MSKLDRAGMRSNERRIRCTNEGVTGSRAKNKNREGDWSAMSRVLHDALGAGQQPKASALNFHDVAIRRCCVDANFGCGDQGEASRLSCALWSGSESFSVIARSFAEYICYRSVLQYTILSRVSRGSQKHRSLDRHLRNFASDDTAVDHHGEEAD